MVKTAVFPVAGLGTRFLPATKANPKEMMPVVDKPLIQYAVEEAVAAGITHLIFVTSYSKRAIEDHFDTNIELERKLQEKNKTKFLATVRDILPNGVSCAYIRQQEALGLGHAVLCAKPFVGDQPFAVLLADDLIDSAKSCTLKQMCDLYRQTKSNVLLVEKVPPIATDKYGIVACRQENVLNIVTEIIEKPRPDIAPSNLAVIGRYVLTPAIFQHLEKVSPGAGGEIQLTDAIAKSLSAEQVLAMQLQGRRYDCGSKLGYVQAIVDFALKHPEIADKFQEYLAKLNIEDFAKR